MDGKLAEQGAERHLLVDRDVLVAQDDHFVLHQRVVHDLELAGPSGWRRSIPSISAPMKPLIGRTLISASAPPCAMR